MTLKNDSDFSHCSNRLLLCTVIKNTQQIANKTAKNETKIVG